MISIPQQEITSSNSIASYHTFVPGELPVLELGILNVEELGHSDAFLSLLANGEFEVRVRNTLACLRSIDRRVDLQPNIEVLSGEKVGPADSIVSFHRAVTACRKTYWSGGKTQPREGQPPRRWKY